MKVYDLLTGEYNEEEEPKEIKEEELEQEEPKQEEDDTWQNFGDLKIDDSIPIGNVYGTKNIYENFENEKLTEELYDIFVNSKYKDLYDTKKPSKTEILEIVLYFLDNLKEPKRFSLCEEIVAIADMIKVDYLSVFNELPQILRYEIIKELDEQYDIVKNKSMKLF